MLERKGRMLLQTILNRVEKHKSFVYVSVTWGTCKGDEDCLDVTVEPRANGVILCSKCGRPAPGYDHMSSPRRFEFVPLWGFPVFLVYTMRRVACRRCGVVVEKIPWAEGKRQMTTTFMWFLSNWAKRLSWKQTAQAFKTSWGSVYRSVEMAVFWGRARVSKEGVTSIGVDEISYGKGHNKYLTLVYQIDEGAKRLLWIGKKRTKKTLERFFNWLGKEASEKLKFVCSDMWKPYITVIAEKAGQAVHVLDRFHIVAKLSKAIDEVRAAEAKELKANGYEPVLTHTRWCLLKRPENLTEKQEVKLAELVKYNLKTVRAYLLKEDFDALWQYVSPGWAEKFMVRWCKRAMRSRLKPMKKVAKMIRAHHDLILNWFRARNQISIGAVEGFNNKVKTTTKSAYGFRSYKIIEIALYHRLGALPEPNFTHTFW
jgi:transposase